MLDELANELKTAREKNLMTLAQLANKSKIDIKFLEAIEHGDFSFLPELYVRAFVKSYARVVGLNENKINKKFDAARQGIPYVEEETVSKETKSKVQETTPKDSPQNLTREKPAAQKTNPEIKKKELLFTFDAVGGGNTAQDSSAAISKRNIIIGASLLGAILLFALIYFTFIDKSKQIIVVEKPIEEVIQQNQRYVENEQAVPSENLGIGISDSLILMINANDTSWIKVSVDEHSTEEFILLPNSQKLLKAKTNYKITLGNSGAIKMQLNSKQLSFPGKNKTPLNVVIDSDGLKLQAKTSP